MGDPSIADRLSLRLLSCLILSLRPKASNRKVREESQNANQDCGPVFLHFSRLSSPIFATGRSHASGSGWVRSESAPELGRSSASQFAEDPGKVALIGEAALGGNDHERPLRIVQQFARGPHLQALPIFPRRSLLNFAKDSRQVDGMHSGFAGQIAHAKRFTESFVQAVFHAAKPARRSLFWEFKSRNGSQHFENMSLHHKRVGRSRLERGVQAKAGPEHISGAAIERSVPGQPNVQMPQVRFAQLNGEKRRAAGSNQSRMCGSRRIENGGKRPQLIESAAVAFEIIALEHHRDIGEFMLMPGQVAGRWLSQLG